MADYSFFVKEDGSTFTVILVYFNDLLIDGNDMEALKEAKEFLSSQFHMKDMGNLGTF